MLTVSPPVSPRVVASILMSQKPRVTSGTLLKVARGAGLTVGGLLRGSRPALSSRYPD